MVHRGCAKSYAKWADMHVVWRGSPPIGYNNQFRIFNQKLTMCQKIEMFFARFFFEVIYLGFISHIPLLGGLLGLLLPQTRCTQWYEYTVTLRNMRFGGSQPFFDKEFTLCGYIGAWYTVACCGCCEGPLKKWVDSNVRMGEPVYDAELAEDLTPGPDSPLPRRLGEAASTNIA